MKIQIKNINEVKTPDKGVLLFVDKDDSKLKGKNSNNEILNFSSSSDSSIKFYKCASVDSTAKTWSGYELILQDGYYELSDVETTGLSYSGMTPEIGLIYNVDTTLRIDLYYEGANAIPKAGLVLYVPLANETSTAETGQAITKNGNPTWQVIDGIPCVYVNQYSNSLTINSAGVPDGDKPTTWSLWVKEVVNSGGEHIGHLLSMKSKGTIDGIDYCQGFNFNIVNSGKVGCGVYSGRTDTWAIADEVIDDKWHHFVLTRDNAGLYSLFIDGVLKASKVCTTLCDNGGFLALGYLAYYSSWGASGYVSNIRIYNRVLSQDEISILANELKPTTEDVPDTPTEGGIEGYKLRVVGEMQGWNWTFVMQETSAKGNDRTWKLDYPNLILAYRSDFGWQIYETYGGETNCLCFIDDRDAINPWDATWFSGDITVTVIE